MTLVHGAPWRVLEASFRLKDMLVDELVKLLGCHSSDYLGHLVVGNAGRGIIDSCHLGVSCLTDFFNGGSVFHGGRLKSLYQSGRGIIGMSREFQKCSKSSGTLRFAVWPWLDADKQKGNLHW